MALNFVQVETFVRNAPHRSPKTLTQVRIAIRTSPIACARVNGMPANEKITCCCDMKGMMFPM